MPSNGGSIMKKRNIKENLISKEYDNNKKGKTLLKLIINGETLFDTKENELSKEEFLKLYNQVGKSSITSLYAFSKLMNETKDKELSYKLTGILTYLIIFTEKELKVNCDINNLCKKLINVCKVKGNKIYNLSMIEILKEVY